MSNSVFSGDDLSLAVQLLKNGASFDIPVTATVQAAIINSDATKLLTSVIDQSYATAGADWSTSLIVVEIPSVESAKLSAYTNGYLEIQITDDGKKSTWRMGLRIFVSLIP